MSERQWKRWDAVARLNAGKLTMEQVATVLGLSGRQVRRLRRAIARAGRQALRHGNAGRSSTNKPETEVRTRIVDLRQEKYRDFNDQHFAEKLATESPPVVVSGWSWHERPFRRVLLVEVTACRTFALYSGIERVQASGMLTPWRPNAVD